MPEVLAKSKLLQNSAGTMYFEAMRLFVGVPVPDGPALAIAALASNRLAALTSSARLRLTHPADLHLTLHFLGETPGERVAEAGAALRGIECSQFPVETGALRVFARAGAVYLEVGRPESLLALAEAVTGRMETRGFRREAHPYHPHITIARIARSAALTLEKDLSTAGRSQDDRSGLRFCAERFNLYRTSSHSEGSKYEMLLSFPLQTAPHHRSS
ncbi:MAG: RNA 2',3'-cyclic phosphodiesterase [Acidobacteriaceae bacterium]